MLSDSVRTHYEDHKLKMDAKNVEYSSEVGEEITRTCKQGIEDAKKVEKDDKQNRKVDYREQSACGIR